MFSVFVDDRLICALDTIKKGETKLRLKNKVAIIPGGGSGIGRATAILFAEHGVRVIVVDISADSGQDTVDKITKNNGARTRRIRDLCGTDT